MRRLALAALCLTLVGCAAREPQTTPEPSTSRPPASQRPSPSASSPSPAIGEAPPELAGTWRRSYGGQPFLLTLHEAGYTVRAGPDTGTGRIFVDDDQITFSHSNQCPEGTGTYAWIIEEDGRLRFTPVGEDPCGRAGFLPRATWGRVDP